MANRYAVANGNWSNTATWDGGTLPAPGDDVRSNGFTVTVDQNITVLSIRNDAFAPAVLGGKFLVNSTGRVINCNIYATSSDCLEASGFSGTINVNGNGYATNTNGSAVIVNGVNITINYTGDLYGGFVNSGGGATSNSGLRVVSGNFNFTGNAYARGGGYACGIYSNAINSINTFTGNAILNPSVLHQTASALHTAGVNHVTVMNGIAECISNLTGELRCSAVYNATGILYGNITAIGSPLGHGSGINGGTGVTLINKSINRTGLGALLGVKYTSVNPTIDVIDENNITIVLSDPAATLPPLESDVRDGVIYGGGAYEGTLIVPIPSDVRKGIATDNTVGTGIITGVDFFNLIATDSDPVAIRLRNVATVQTVGDQFNSF